MSFVLYRMSSLSLIHLALAPSNLSVSHIEVNRKDSSDLRGTIFSSSVCLMRDTDFLISVLDLGVSV